MIPSDYYGDLVYQIENNLATVRSITANFQQSLRESRWALAPPTQTNLYQPGDLVLFNAHEHEHSLRSSKLAPKGSTRCFANSRTLHTILARTYLRTASTLQGLQTLDPFTDMYTYTGMCLAHPLDIVNTF